MTNTSRTGGYLNPTSAAPLDDDALTDFFSAVIGGMTGIPGTLIFPRWQPEAPNQPTIATNWAAIAVTQQDSPPLASVQHVHTGAENSGADYLSRQEELTVALTFYGPNAGANAGLVRDGFAIAQNREALQLAGFAWVEADTIRNVPELINNQWYPRRDITFSVRRLVARIYPVLDILSSAGSVSTDGSPHGTYNTALENNS